MTTRRTLGTGPDHEHQDDDWAQQGPRFLPVELIAAEQTETPDAPARPPRHARRPLGRRDR